MAIYMVWRRLQWLNHGKDAHKSLVTFCDWRKGNWSDRSYRRQRLRNQCFLIFWVSTVP
jgi:hypothetical protein